MPDDFTPDVAGLAADYRILAELRRATGSRTFLARHVGLNRDVILTVTAPSHGADGALLAHLAADARALSVMRHPNVVPVVEARWLADGSLAVARARVRGPTLDAAIRSNTVFPLSRVADILSQAEAVIRWARENGVVNRRLAGDGIVLQQGSGRVLVELEVLSELGDRPPDAHDDARTIGQLAYALLAGQQVGEAASSPLTELRPDLSEPIISELSALATSDREAPAPDPRILIDRLATASEAVVVDVPRATPAADVIPSPLMTRSATDVAEKRSYGFIARLAVLAAASTVLGAAGTLFYRRDSNPPAPLSAQANATRRSTAAGEVTRHPAKPDTHARVVVASDSARPSADTSGSRANERAVGASTPVRAGTVPVAQSVSPPVVPTRSEMPRRDPPRSVDQKAFANPSPVVSMLPACDSPDAEDQHTCLTGIVDQNDREMNAVYQRLIVALRRVANGQPGGPDPANVDSLKKMQRDWLAARDVACRNVGDAPMYAEARAQCFADLSTRRLHELQQQLAVLGNL